MIKTGAKKTLFSNTHFSVESVELVLPSQNITQSVVYRRPTVSIFPISKNNEVYLINQYRYLYEATILEATAGYIDNGEDPLTAAKRELHEETGISAKTWEELSAIEMSASVVKATSYLFIARDLEFRQPQPEEDEEISLVKMPIAVAMQKIKNGDIKMSVTIVGLLLLERMVNGNY